MRLIDADELKKGICAQCTLNGCGCLEKIGAGCDWDSIYHIEHAPTIDPVKHGYWIVQPMDDMPGLHHERYTCSECDGSYIGQRKRNFCPDCGAKMDGENG